MNALISPSVFFGSALTIAFYALGYCLKRRFKLAVLNPILIGVICVIGFLTATDIDYEVYA